MDTDPCFLTIDELGALLRRRDISARQLVEAFLERLDGIGRRLGAVVTLTDELALAAATQADVELAHGIDRGPLHGIPYGMKDIVATAGAPVTWGAEIFRDRMSGDDATVVRRLRDAGAVMVAKLATIEIAGGMGYDHPNASLTSVPRNPHDPTTWTSGSSSGPSAAVAAGLVAFAIGSDTGGSILLPAAWTGTAGLRATYGRVSRHGAMTLCPTLDRLGPMCRTAEDCGLVLAAIAGQDPQDSSTMPGSFRFDSERLRRHGFRVGVIDGAAEGADPAIAAAFDHSVDVIRQLGTVEIIDLPDLPYQEVADVVIAAEAYASFDEFIASGRTAELTASKARTHRLAGALLPAHDYIRAQRIRRQIGRAVDEVLGQYDAVVAPTIGTFASGADEDFPYMLAKAFARPLNYAGVLTGSPTVSILNGFERSAPDGSLSEDRGLPSGLALAGARGQEEALLGVAVALERQLDLPVGPPPGLAAWLATSLDGELR